MPIAERHILATDMRARSDALRHAHDSSRGVVVWERELWTLNACADSYFHARRLSARAIELSALNVFGS